HRIAACVERGDKTEISGECTRRIETLDPMQLGDEDHRHGRIDSTKAAQPRDMLTVERKLRCFRDLAVERLKATFRLLDRKLVFGKDDAVGDVLKTDAIEPSAMGGAPKATRRQEDVTTSNEHLHEPVPATSEVRAHVLSATTEIANGFLLR